MADEICRYCGVGRHAAERCPRVSAIEYNDGAGTIKRIEFFPPRPISLPQHGGTEPFRARTPVEFPPKSWMGD